MPEFALPAARHLSLTWELPIDFGGMTTAFLRRNRAFELLGGRTVDVLTFDAGLHYPAFEHTLRERGLLTPTARVINLWDWLRDHPVGVGSEPDAPAPPAFAPLEADPRYETGVRDGVVLTRTRRSAEGELLQVDHFRADGSLLASDRRDAKTRGVVGGRIIVLCDPAGRAVSSWSRAGDLYREWLDLLVGGDPTVMIVDSKTVANFMLGYRRRNVTTVHVLHGSHLNDRQDDLRESRRAVLARLGEFDLVVTATERQRADLAARVPGAHNLVCIPNGVTVRPAAPAGAREPDSIAVLAALLPLKRVSHAINAVAAANAARDRPVRLTIYGDGPQRAKLTDLVARVGAERFVTFAGHRPDAEQALATTSMLLLTSHSEGFGLVLLEAMANGCIPIAYDVPYGPADLIENGVNGFLVPNADVEGLAARIREVLELDGDAVERMRANARRTAARYSDEESTRRWSAALRRASGLRGRVRRVGLRGRATAGRLRRMLRRAVRPSS